MYDILSYIISDGFNEFHDILGHIPFVPPQLSHRKIQYSIPLDHLSSPQITLDIGFFMQYLKDSFLLNQEHLQLYITTSQGTIVSASDARSQFHVTTAASSGSSSSGTSIPSYTGSTVGNGSPGRDTQGLQAKKIWDLSEFEHLKLEDFNPIEPCTEEQCPDGRRILTLLQNLVWGWKLFNRVKITERSSNLLHIFYSIINKEKDFDCLSPSHVEVQK